MSGLINAWCRMQRSGEGTQTDMFTDEQLEALINAQSIEKRLPFDSADDNSIRGFYEPLVRRIENAQKLKSQIEWNHYGSGYASFIDAWFYPSDATTRVSPHGEHHVGIFVLLSRLTRYFVVGQGEKAWSTKGRSGYMPDFDLTDTVKHPVLIDHVDSITILLAEAGLTRLRKDDLAARLPLKFGTPTILSSSPYRHFDALFHWND